MRKVTRYLIICILYLSCTKEKEEVVVFNPAPTAATVQLKIDQVINDSTLVLKWSKYTGTFQNDQQFKSAHHYALKFLTSEAFLVISSFLSVLLI
jgi:hypothetical protein